MSIPNDERARQPTWAYRPGRYSDSGSGPVPGLTYPLAMVRTRADLARSVVLTASTHPAKRGPDTGMRDDRTDLAASRANAACSPPRHAERSEEGDVSAGFRCPPSY